MISSPALPCPRCKRVLGPESWTDGGGGTCFRCKTDYECIEFPALRASPSPVAAHRAVLADDSVCFFHGENRAESICDGCGRLLCPVCAVPLGGRKLCPTCIAGGQSLDGPAFATDRVLYDGMALSLALLPLLIWPFTLLTAPATIGMVIYGWNKPGSLVRGRSRLKLVIAGNFALLQIAGWAVFITVMWLKR